MATRSVTQAKEEKAIFEAFLGAHRAFAVEVKEFRQPDAEFPDIVSVSRDGTEVDFELGEWLDGAQMGAAMRYDRLAEAILDAIGPQDPNPSGHFRAVMLTPREGAPSFAAADWDGFRTEVWALVGETDHRWPGERFWKSPQGHLCREFDRYPLLGKYLGSVHFYPLVVRGEEQPRAAGQPWIFVEAHGGSYSPDTAVRALCSILDQKIAHYGKFSRPTRLVIHYGRVAYNAPYLGVETRDFADVAAFAATAVAGQTAFEKIYLLNALEPGLEAYEIFPTCQRCL